jgi:hypothetical protein
MMQDGPNEPKSDDSPGRKQDAKDRHGRASADPNNRTLKASMIKKNAALKSAPHILGRAQVEAIIA